MSTFWLKIIACVTMLLDHAAIMLNQAGLNETSIWYILMRTIGRTAFPIFAFLIATGFRYTRSRPKYLVRLLVCAVISQPFFIWLLAQENILINLPVYWNTLFTLATGVLCLIIIEAFREKPPKKAALLAILLVPLLVLMISEIWYTDYGISGILLIVLLYLLPADRPALQALLALIWGGGLYALAWPQPLGILPAAAAIYFYNQKPGPKVKWLFYAFYPVHLAVLCLLRILLPV